MFGRSRRCFIPPNLNFIEAASIPTAFLTAFYGLESVARVQGGERVPDPYSYGWSRTSGDRDCTGPWAEIMATAGSAAKRDYLRQRGILQVFDSRSLDFADQISGGVDIILNTLSGEAVARGLGLHASHLGGSCRLP
jgi:NADPH:quinone reductase-like Zn-dependent oxidoreductase